MGSLRSRIDREALNWANETFSRAGFSGGGDVAAEADILGMERHIAECMWTLVTKCKASAAESLPGATKSFYRLMNILSEIGLSAEDDTSGLFLPVPRHDADCDATNKLLQFPPEEHEGEYTQHAQLVSESLLLRNHYMWAPLYCIVLFDLSPPENVIRFLDDCDNSWWLTTEGKDISPVHEILLDGTRGSNQLSNAERVELLKVIQKFSPWIFRVRRKQVDDRGSLPLHSGIAWDMSFEVLQVVVDSYPEAAGIYDAETMCTPISCLLEPLLTTCTARELDDKEIDMLKYLINVTPQEIFLLRNNEGCTPLHDVLREFGSFPSLRLMRLIFDACPAAAKLLCGITDNLPLESYCRNCFIHYTSTSELTVAELEAANPEIYLLLRDLVAATGDALRIPDRNYVHRLCQRPWLPALQLVCEAYPEAVRMNVPRVGTPLISTLHWAGVRWAAAKYIYDLYPDAVLMKEPAFGENVMHAAVAAREFSPFACWKWLHDCNPAAIREKNSDGNLPIHIFVCRFITIRSSAGGGSLAQVCKSDDGYYDELRWFLRLYPESAAIPNAAGRTPYDIFLSSEYPLDEFDPFGDNRTAPETLTKKKKFVRAFLTACPRLDLQRLGNLNYAARREALNVIKHLRCTPKPATFCTEHRVENIVELEETENERDANGDVVVDGNGDDTVSYINNNIIEDPSRSDLKLAEVTYTAWWQLANIADMSIVKEVVSYL